MLALFTDFGLDGPYIGQMKAVLHRDAPGVPVIDLLADAPPFQAMAGAYLLAAYGPALPDGTIIVAVVDPGVGSDRDTVMLEADGRWYVGPENGLMALVARRAAAAQAYPLWPRGGVSGGGDPGPISASFHGRDLFAPAAARLARGERPDPASGRPPATVDRPDWPDDLGRIIYIDHYGNAMTGLRAHQLAGNSVLTVHGRAVHRARTFSDVPAGTAFWYENANGLAEIAVNQGRACDALGLAPGDAVAVRPSGVSDPPHGGTLQD
jgi:S-adenosylmethionine hydrolase